MNTDRDMFLQIVKSAPLISIDLIVRNSKGEILTGLRTNMPAQDTWFVPGGRIHKGELIKNSFSRITRQELGVELDISDAEFIGVFEHFYDDNFAQVPDIGTHYVVLAYEINLSTDSVKPPLEQHKGYRWQSEADLLQAPDVHPNTKAFLTNRKVSPK